MRQLLFACLFGLCFARVSAMAGPPQAFDIEGGWVFPGYNDVRIPGRFGHEAVADGRPLRGLLPRLPRPIHRHAGRQARPRPAGGFPDDAIRRHAGPRRGFQRRDISGGDTP